MNKYRFFLLFTFLIQFLGLKSYNLVRATFIKPEKKVQYISGIEGWRLGAGLGTSLYVGDQMDFTITRHYGEFNELRTNITLGAYKYLNTSKEFGFVYKHGGMQTLKSNNTQYVECFFDEIQVNFQKSLNGDIGMHGNKFTANFQYGLGLMYYKSRTGSVDPFSKGYGTMLSSVGYGYFGRKGPNGKELLDIYNKKFAPVGNIGLNIGYKISKNLALYWENSFQVSLSNKLSGNLYKTSSIPPDCYLYSGFSVYYSFGNSSGRLGCPNLNYYRD